MKTLTMKSTNWNKALAAIIVTGVILFCVFAAMHIIHSWGYIKTTLH